MTLRPQRPRGKDRKTNFDRVSIMRTKPIQQTGALVALMLSLFLAGCTTTQKTAGAGTALGAAAGGIIGHQSGRGWEGAALGGVIGGLTGALAGDAREDRDRDVREAYEQGRQDGRNEPPQ